MSDATAREAAASPVAPMLAALEFEVYCTRGDDQEQFRVATDPVRLVPGDVLALTGPSGCGKSTVLEVLGLVLAPDAGSHCWWHTRNGSAADLADQRLRRGAVLRARLRTRALGFVLQSGGLLPYLRVQENISLPRAMSGTTPWDPSVEALVDRLGIAALLRRWPSQLSVGERQRVAIARALAHHPWLLLADEPTAALDPARAEAVMGLIVDLVRERERIAVIVTHDRDLVERLGLRQLRAQLTVDRRAATFREEPQA